MLKNFQESQNIWQASHDFFEAPLNKITSVFCFKNININSVVF